jgi:hypothetical protein
LLNVILSVIVLSVAMGIRIMMCLVLHSVIMGVGIVPSVVLLSVIMVIVIVRFAECYYEKCRCGNSLCAEFSFA